MLAVFALILFACASEDVTQGTSVHSTVPPTARSSASNSTSGMPTTTNGDSLTTAESSTTETTGVTTAPSTTGTPSPLTATSPTTTMPTTTTTTPTTTTPTTTTLPNTHNLSIGDKFFEPTTVTISVGDTVEWINGGDKGHTVTSGAVGNPDGLWDSGVLIGGASFSQTFTTSGTFQYFCKIHGDKMEATVIVEG